MSAEGSSVKGSNQQSSTSGPKVKGGGLLFSGQGPLITGGLVNDTTPEHNFSSNFPGTELEGKRILKFFEMGILSSRRCC